MRPDLRRASVSLWAAAWIGAAGCPAPEAPEAPGPPLTTLGELFPTDSGSYRISVRPEDPPAPVGRLHRWIVHLETAEGQAFEPTRLTVGGGMPQHGHGFVTEPRATQSLGAGDFLIEGVKFHMAGEWTLQFAFTGPAGNDGATARVQIDP
jgi:hypothetical protein